MKLNTRASGNIAVSKAVAYFAAKNYYIFLPIGDNGGSIDLIVSADGKHIERVQCKYTSQVHSELRRRYKDIPERWEYRVNLTEVKSNAQTSSQMFYTEDSFELLFVSTPVANYLFDWKELCSTRSHPPTSLFLGKKFAKFRLANSP